MGASVALFEIATFAVATVAAIVALWSLAWHLRARRAMSRLSVSDGHGVLLGSEGGELVVIIRAENTGTYPVDVIGWGFRARRGVMLTRIAALPASTDVPAVLRPTEDASFFVLMRDFERALRESGSSSARPFVTIAPRTTVSARRRVRPVPTVADGPELGGALAYPDAGPARPTSGAEAFDS